MAKTLFEKVLCKVEDQANALLAEPIVQPAEVGNRLIAERIASGKPFFAGRLGTTESNNLSWYLRFNKNLGLPFPRDRKEGSWTAAGLFPPSDRTLRRWCQLCEGALSLTDVYCSWKLVTDGYYRTRNLAQAEFVDLPALDAYLFPEPWTAALEGKRVLVVHPFVRTIEAQYRDHRVEIFPDRKVLPDFTLMTVQAPQTIAGNTGGFGSWDEAFERTCQTVDRLDFDVALVGAGSYGMPLSAQIRRSGRSVVYVGGALQVFFGIRGKRWDNSGFYNESWVSPSDLDRPQNFQAVEKGCYW